MRFLTSVIDNQTRSANSTEMAAIDEFNDALRAKGYWIFACGLDYPSTAKLIDNRSGAGITSEGALHNSSEYISGFWIIDVPDESTAQQMAVEGSKACNRRVELRPLLG